MGWRILAASLAAAALAASGATAGGQRPYAAPRTASGQPDLEGLWTTATLTPFERDPKFGERRELTPEEARAQEAAASRVAADASAPTGADATAKDVPCGLTKESCEINAAWQDSATRLLRVNGEARTSILIEPPDGRLPLTAVGKARQIIQFGDRLPRNNPEERTMAERCLMFPTQEGPPILPGMYNNYLQIVQAPGHVAIHTEQIHDVRIVRLGGRHPPPSVRQWMGDSIGRWEGATLVVETTNMRAEQAAQGETEAALVTERFTRIGPDEILYRFTIEDPAAYARPVAGELMLKRTKGPLYEYACHDGDRGMEGILGGARYEERTAARQSR